MSTSHLTARAGFVSYADVCWFQRNNYFVRRRFDAAACSPYLHAGSEWLSYEDEQSVACKAAFVRSGGFGGAMVFSLNADDWRGECVGSGNGGGGGGSTNGSGSFPLVRRMHETLFGRPVPDGSAGA